MYPSIIAFVAAVFFANFPEAMGCSGTLRLCRMRVSTILLMWTAMFVGVGVGATAGSLLFPRGRGGPSAVPVASIEGFCAGATLTMVASTIMPEAFEQGGEVVGIVSLAGFLIAMIVKVIVLEVTRLT